MILLINNSSDLLDCYKELFEPLDPDIHTANDIFEAIEKLSDCLWQCRLIVTDLYFSKGPNGASLARLLRTLAPKVPVVLLSDTSPHYAEDAALFYKIIVLNPDNIVLLNDFIEAFKSKT